VTDQYNLTILARVSTPLYKLVFYNMKIEMNLMRNCS
jgi:hypothetical protein